MTKELLTLFAVFIALFLFGMTVMRAGLTNIVQDKFKEKLLTLTDSPIKGLIVGTIVTAILQSSSAVMIITVGLVAAGYITFKHSIGIILGSNIGTVVTLEILAIDLSAMSLPLLLLGVFLLMIPKHASFCAGCISFGLACIFIAMQGLEKLAYPLASLPFTHSFFQLTNDSGIIGVGVGTALSAIIQSSTATTAIAMGFMSENMLALPAGVAIMLGANIGTCFSAFLASIGTNSTARLVAYAHIWLNILGVLLFLPFIETLSNFSTTLTTIPTLQLAHASTIFNIICSLLMLPFVHYYSRFIIMLHGKKAS